MNRSGINTGPGLLGDPMSNPLLAAAAKLSSQQMGINDGPKDNRDRRDRDKPPRWDHGRRDARDIREARRKRSRSPVKRSPPPRARSPVRKREKTRPAPRYVVQVPKIQLDV